jgi:hypothetical protein
MAEMPDFGVSFVNHFVYALVYAAVHGFAYARLVESSQIRFYNSGGLTT